MSGSILPSVKEPIADGEGKIGPSWYRLLATFERLLNATGVVPGAGLTNDAIGQLTIADGGVSDTMLRDALALSVVGNPLNALGDTQDIIAAANDRVLQRTGDLLGFGYLSLASFTSVTQPSAINNPRTMIFRSDSGVPAFSNGTSWQLLGISGAGVASFNTRTGAVTLTSGDVTTALGFTPAHQFTVVSKSATYTEATTAGEIFILATGTFTINLPTAVGNTAKFSVKLITAGAITVDPAGAETIDGAATAVISAQYASISFISDGANWAIF